MPRSPTATPTPDLSTLAASLPPGVFEQLVAEAAAEAERRSRHRESWPDRHIPDPEGHPAPFHLAQSIASEAPHRIVAMLAGTQSGKTRYGPFWCFDETFRVGHGDYLAVTATYDLFKLKMLPALRETFEHIYQVGRYWSGDRIIEIADPATGRFLARRPSDRMWGRIILRSADALSGLESASALWAWLDEAGQPGFTYSAWRAILRRLSLSRGRMLISSTLFDFGWLDTEIILPAKKGAKSVHTEIVNGGEVEVTDNPDAGILLIQYDSIINPSFSHEEFNEQKKNLPREDFEAFYRGRRAATRLYIYDTFDFGRHTCKRFDIPALWPRYVGVDFGGVYTCAVFYAHDPKSGRYYAYREYLEGRKTIREHVSDILSGERPFALSVGGSGSEQQWRDEFASHGLSLEVPSTGDVEIGIQRVYAAHRNDAIIYFDDLDGLLGQKTRYRRKRDPLGNITDEIENKKGFHYMDAERYIVSELFVGDSDQTVAW